MMMMVLNLGRALVQGREGKVAGSKFAMADAVY